MSEPGRGEFDAFVSYAHADADWVRVLVGRLTGRGLSVFVDEHEVLAGDVIVHRLEQGICGSRTGVVVFSPRSVTSAWVRNEYAALMTRALEGTARFIPVLYGDVAIPPFAAARRWVDFRDAVGDAFDAKVAELAEAIRGRAAGPPAGPRPPGEPVRPEGPLHALLQITPDQVTFRPGGTASASPGPDVAGFQEPGGAVTHRPAGVRHRLTDLWMRLQIHRPGEDVPTKADAVEAGRHALLTGIGAELGAGFLDGAAGRALAAEVTRAERLGERLLLGLEIDDTLAGLPWETLILPGQAEPLALHPRVQMFRRVAGDGTTPVPQIPGPLRILVAVAAPDGPGGGRLLNYEAELARILDAVDPARRQAGAYVRVLSEGTVTAIREALQQERFHVLHISCHARPGALTLEDERGGRDEVTTARFIREALPAGRGVPLIVLSGCSTALPVRAARAGSSPDGAGEAALGGLAHGLCAAGVPSVLAMTASVTDAYATAFAATLYRELATRQIPEVLPACCDARRRLEAERRHLPGEDPRAAWAEWATPALFLRGPSLPLYVPGHVEPVERPPDPYLPDVPLRPVGDFVGRRAELRALSAALRGDRPGVLLHGIGGVGKSSLAAELLRRSAGDTGLLVCQVGQTSPDQILDAFGLALLASRDDVDLHRLAELVRRPRYPWRDRLSMLGPLLARLPVTLLLDNFEDNLEADGTSWRVRDEELAGLLSAWIRSPGRSRLIVTSRFPFVLPHRAERRLVAHHLGPLSWPETRKLLWRLPALDALSPGDQLHAYTDVGGHPRALEYLDALLRGGRARFDDITRRLEEHLARRGITDPDAWFGAAGADLDRALAEAVTLAVDDVLLGELLDGLDDLARRVLVGVSVFRVPVDAAGVAWPVSQVAEREADPVVRERVRRARRAAARAREAGVSDEELARLQADWRASVVPPWRVPKELAGAVAALERAGLLSPVPGQAGATGDFGSGAEVWAGSAGRRWVVHRWTAATLARAELTSAEEITAAHRAAAVYWLWPRVWLQDARAAVADLVEARFHLRAAGDVAGALQVTGQVCARLHVWGAWGREEQMYREVLSWLPDQSTRPAAAVYHQLGVIAHERGDYDRALEYYRRSLAVLRELGDRAAMSSSYHNLGAVAQERGDYDRALEYYRRSLAIRQQVGDRAGTSHSYHQLGMLAQAQGNYDQALEYYQRSLAILRELGDQAGIGTSYHQLGAIAQAQGDYDRALEYYRRSLAIAQQVGDRAGTSHSYHQLGMLAQAQGDHDQALEYYQRSLAIDEELGDRAGVSASCHQLGMLAQMQGDHDRALEYYRRSLAIAQQVGDRAGTSHSYHQLGTIAHIQGDYDRALEYYQRSLDIDEELGDRAGTSASYHQLGMVAQAQGDHDRALEYYRRSLAIAQQVGDRAGVAAATSQIGVLYTESGRAAEAVAHSLQALAAHLRLRTPRAMVDLHWLARQRTALGAAEFTRILAEHLDPASAAALVHRLDNLEADEDGASSAGP